ncbi:MAG: hypothetical protein PHU47_02500 [Candidatus ainarchaeum sp.]|nr:hypothetical protein [Candidatus ainarchaeum sp.]
MKVKSEKTKLIIWAVVALVVGVVIGMLITNATTGNAKKALNSKNVESLVNSELIIGNTKVGEFTSNNHIKISSNYIISEQTDYDVILVDGTGGGNSINAGCLCSILDATPGTGVFCPLTITPGNGHTNYTCNSSCTGISHLPKPCIFYISSGGHSITLPGATVDIYN